jgi:acyl dehydratase
LHLAQGDAYSADERIRPSYARPSAARSGGGVMLELTVAELAEAEGRDLGTSPWRTIDQGRVDTFADATDDHQWIHVDPERAADGPFGGTIAHGYLSLSLVPTMLKTMLTVTDFARGTNYGIERVRFTSPIGVGARIRLAASLASTRRREDGGVQWAVAFRVEVEGQTRPAVIGETIYVYYGRD